LFRATPAHRILAFRAFPTQPAATSLDAHCSLAVQSAPTFAGCPARAIAPTSVLFAEPTPRLSIFLPRYPCDHRTGADISHAAHRRTSKPNHERPTPALKRRRRTPKQASTSSLAACPYGFRTSQFGYLGLNACLTAPPSLSQSSTPFVASWRQDIPHVPLVAWPH
jgi:hypothetical protein